MKQVSGLRKFWNEHPLALAMTLILVYVVGTGHLRNSIGDESIFMTCLLYTSDAADDLIGVDLGGRRLM